MHSFHQSLFGRSNEKMAITNFLKRLEVKPTDDEFESIKTSRWGNRDVYPIAHDKRTYGVYAFVSYWGIYFLPPFFLLSPTNQYIGTCGICLSSWTIGSSLIGIGLTPGQAMASVVCELGDGKMSN